MSGNGRTEAQKRFEHRAETKFEIGQYTDMGMWFVRRTTVEVVALATGRAKAIAIQEAFEKAVAPDLKPAP